MLDDIDDEDEELEGGQTDYSEDDLPEEDQVFTVLIQEEEKQQPVINRRPYFYGDPYQF